MFDFCISMKRVDIILIGGDNFGPFCIRSFMKLKFMFQPKIGLYTKWIHLLGLIVILFRTVPRNSTDAGNSTFFSYLGDYWLEYTCKSWTVFTIHCLFWWHWWWWFLCWMTAHHYDWHCSHTWLSLSTKTKSFIFNTGPFSCFEEIQHSKIQ